MKTLIQLTFLFLLSFSAYSQKWVKGHKYSYKIEAPVGFYEKTPTGANTDIALRDEGGNSIVIVVTRLPEQLRGTSAATALSEVSNSDFVEMAEQSLDNVKLVKRGTLNINGVSSHYANVTHQSSTGGIVLYAENYYIWHNGYQYLVTLSCQPKNRDSVGANFYRAIRSFSF